MSTQTFEHADRTVADLTRSNQEEGYA